MAVNLMRGNADEVIDQIVAALQAYEADHPGAEIAIYRQNVVSIRIRIIDPHFVGLSRTARSEKVWRYFASLAEETQSDISTLLLLSPDEVSRSTGNIEFEDPLPSVLL